MFSAFLPLPPKKIQIKEEICKKKTKLKVHRDEHLRIYIVFSMTHLLIQKEKKIDLFIILVNKLLLNLCLSENVGSVWIIMLKSK